MMLFLQTISSAIRICIRFYALAKFVHLDASLLYTAVLQPDKVLKAVFIRRCVASAAIMTFAHATRSSAS